MVADDHASGLEQLAQRMCERWPRRDPSGLGFKELERAAGALDPAAAHYDAERLERLQELWYRHYRGRREQDAT